MPNPSEALTRPDLSEKERWPTHAARPGNARSEIMAPAEPYMLTIQGGPRSMRIEGGLEGGKKGKKDAWPKTTAGITARPVPEASPKRRWKRELAAGCVPGTPAHGPAKWRPLGSIPRLALSDRAWRIDRHEPVETGG